MTVENADASREPLSLPAFDYDPRTRVVFGAGSLARLGELARELGAGRALVVSDHGIRDAGHAQRGVDALRAAGIETLIYDDVHPSPTTRDVDLAVEFVGDRDIDLIVGLGGGSSMDVAKGVNFLLTNGGRMEDYLGVGKATRPMLPLIAVPTTAGTGSEAQSYAVIADARTHMKMACGDKKAAARIALLDPELTVTMPASVTAATGIDAISHAIESYVTTARNPVSQLFARRAWNLLSRAFPAVVREPQRLTARGAMLLGAHLAGAAIENSMLGATHALANPLSAHFDTVHGVAIGVLLPHVVRYNRQAVGRLYGDLAEDAGLCSSDDPAAADRLSDLITSFVRQSGAPASLKECGVDQSLIPQLAAEAAQQWTGRFNPRPVDAGQLQELYQCAFHPAK